MKRSTIVLVGVLLALVSGSLVAASGIREAYALNKPPGRSGWEKHNISTYEGGAQASIPAAGSTLVLTGTDWWWARSFVFHASYILNSSYGAVGAGIAKYIPLGQTNPVYQDLKYEWNGLTGSQGYDFGSAQTGLDYEVYSTGLGDGCWNRFTNTLGWDQYCINSFNNGHPSFQATTNTASGAVTKNTIAGAFNTVKYKATPTSSFTDFGNDNGGKYCSETGTSIYKIQADWTTNANKLSTGSSASVNSCTSPDGSVYDLPG